MSLTDQSSALLPFRALRPRTDLPGGLAATIGPPADIDTTADARAFVTGRPYSAIRLEIEDQHEALSFSEAQRLLTEWRQSGVIARDDDQSYYVYEQGFDDYGVRRTRLGVFGLVPLDVPEVCVLPHEETWKENRQRRLQLLRELGASVSPIFLIYDGRSNPSDVMLQAIVQRDPDAAAVDDFGNSHRLWAVSNPIEVDQIRTAMSNRHFIIADGHHRFAAAQLLHQELGTAETGMVLACCVEAHDPGIVIRPIHRLIHNRDALDLISAMGELAGWFEIESVPVGNRSGFELTRTLSTGELPEAGIITNEGATLVTVRLRNRAAVESLLPDDLTSTARNLDVTVITELVMQRALKIDLASPDAISYHSDPDHVLDAARGGAAGLGILMRPIRLAQVLDVARAHDRVPAKSTSFFPKIPVGLVMHELRAEE